MRARAIDVRSPAEQVLLAAHAHPKLPAVHDGVGAPGIVGVDTVVGARNGAGVGGEGGKVTGGVGAKEMSGVGTGVGFCVGGGGVGLGTPAPVSGCIAPPHFV
jgi:hypothetical protein